MSRGAPSRDANASSKEATSSTPSSSRRTRTPAPSSTPGPQHSRPVRVNGSAGAILTEDGEQPSTSSSSDAAGSRKASRPANGHAAARAPAAAAAAGEGKAKGAARGGKQKAAPMPSAPLSSSRGTSVSSSAVVKSTLPPVVLQSSRGTAVTIEPALLYLHMLARDPTLSDVHLQSRYQREILSWRDMPQPRETQPSPASNAGSRKRAREHAAVPSSLPPSASSVPPPSMPSPPRPVASSLPTDLLSPFQSSGMHIHPSLQPPAPPPLPSFPHPLHPLLVPPPLPRRRKPVDRCTSPSHFLLTPFALTPYGPDYSMDLPLRTRMDELLLAVLAGCLPPRLVMAEDTSKVWMDADAATGKTRAYNALERLLSPLRRRRPREHWSLREMAVFELAVCLHGKDFARIARLVGSKGTSEVVEFYYTTWKHSEHYAVWKNGGRPIAPPPPPPAPRKTAQQQPQDTVTIIISDDEEALANSVPVAAPPASSTLSSSPTSPPPSLLPRTSPPRGRTRSASRSRSPPPQSMPVSLFTSQHSSPQLLSDAALTSSSTGIPILALLPQVPILSAVGEEKQPSPVKAWSKVEKEGLPRFLPSDMVPTNGMVVDENGSVGV